jgi:hypothetical protein
MVFKLKKKKFIKIEYFFVFFKKDAVTIDELLYMDVPTASELSIRGWSGYTL